MIFFDMDGTLIDSNRVWVDLDEVFAARRGLTVSEEYRQVICKVAFPAAAEYTKEYYGLAETPQQIMDEWMDLAHDAYANHVPLKPGAVELLKKLQSGGERMAVFTASPPELCYCCMKRHALAPYFEGYFFSQNTGLEKGNPAIYRLACQHFQAETERCVLIDDSPDNCAAARKAGLRTVGVYDTFYAHRWPEVESSCDLAIRSLEELIKR